MSLANSAGKIEKAEDGPNTRTFIDNQITGCPDNQRCVKRDNDEDVVNYN